MWLNELKSDQKRLIKQVLSKIDYSLIPPFLFYSYLGARICYADTHPLNLFFEEKFKNFERFKDFLLHLKKMGHFSVFAHTPIYVDAKDFDVNVKFDLARCFFKIFWYKNLAIFNLRHFAETLDEEEFLKLIDYEPELDKVEVVIFKSGKEVFRDSFLNLKLVEEGKDLWATPEVIIIKIKKEHNPKWIGVIAHNFSRIFSHQFVRHTWLNFNQRSHRYTKVDRFVIPSAFKDVHIKKYKEIIENCMEVYDNFCRDMKRESARFVVPQGVATTVLATAPEFIWQDFVNKRAIPQAQDEIRGLAKIIEKELSMGL